ncbi:MAG: hypothetical protein L0H23_07010, partial [Luteimonas sp.]|nr:hypothetical protein [Luteimonas sp.]
RATPALAKIAPCKPVPTCSVAAFHGSGGEKSGSGAVSSGSDGEKSGTRGARSGKAGARDGSIAPFWCVTGAERAGVGGCNGNRGAEWAPRRIAGSRAGANGAPAIAR